MSGARNLHRLAGALERAKREALDGPCRFCPQPTVGYVQGWNNRVSGVCETHAAQGERLGYTVHRDVTDSP